MKVIVDGRGLAPTDRTRLLEKFGNNIGYIILDECPYENCLTLQGANYLDKNGRTVGIEVQIESDRDMQSVMETEITEGIEFIIFRTADWKIIPLENVIAKFHDASIQVGTPTKTPEELKLASTILEIGIDLALLEGTPTAIEEMLNWISADQGSQMNLDRLEVMEISKIGTADRVCVDTCAVLRKGEGLLVGNTSKLFALIEAEVDETGYVAARPFRVNAGAIAAYVLNSDKTNYLSELKAGAKVMVVAKDGTTRKELVCRVKIERRPMVLVKLKSGNNEAPVIVQDAETVRFVTPEGAVSVKDLEPGMTVLGSSQSRGRHFGMEVDEFIEEH